MFKMLTRDTTACLISFVSSDYNEDVFTRAAFETSNYEIVHFDCLFIIYISCGQNSSKTDCSTSSIVYCKTSISLYIRKTIKLHKLQHNWLLLFLIALSFFNVRHKNNKAVIVLHVKNVNYFRENGYRIIAINE